MKWVGIQYGEQMDPEEPMGKEHNFGVDGLGENNLGDDYDDGYPARHVPQSEEWWVGLRQCILEKGTDNDGEILSEESIRICSNERWWATFVTLVRFVRIQLCITVGNNIGNSKTRLTNYLADLYGYEQNMGKIQEKEEAKEYEEEEEEEEENENEDEDEEEYEEEEESTHDESSEEAEWEGDESSEEAE